MELTQEILNDLFPHSSIESLGSGEYKVQSPWCHVDITGDKADLELIEEGKSPRYWSFTGIDWQERLVKKVVDIESISTFFLVGPTKQGSIHLPSSYYVVYSEGIRTHSSCSSSYTIWRAWNSRLLLCSVYFHRNYLW